MIPPTYPRLDPGPVMPSRWRTARVFISSTFRDMHAERDQLVRRVFPVLRARFEPHRIHVDDLDLRWGVTREQQANRRVLELCFGQIDECRPFFLGILGERYGSVLPAGPAVGPGPARSVTDLEVRRVLHGGAGWDRGAAFFLRDPGALDGVPLHLRDVYAETDPERVRLLAEVKAEIRNSRFPVRVYPARWDAAAFDRAGRPSGQLAGLEEFGRAVLDCLDRFIRAEFGLPAGNPVPAAADPWAEEADHHARFAESRVRVYAGREELHRRLADYAAGDDPRICLVTGPPGSGKSAVLARFVTAPAAGPNAVCLVTHFVGAAPRSASLREMLRRLCHTLRSAAYPEDTPGLVAAFLDLVAKFPADRRAVIVINAVDQLDPADHAHDLYWLPARLPAHVKVVVSCPSGAAGASVLGGLARLGPMRLDVGPLTRDERREVVGRVPSIFAKQLEPEQAELLLENPATESPLFLLAALEELRGFGSFEGLTDRVAALPGPGLTAAALYRAGLSARSLAADPTAGLFTQVIERLEGEFDRIPPGEKSVPGRSLVATVLAALATARAGLSESELGALVAGLGAADDLHLLLRQLRPYLLARGPQTDLYHAAFAAAVRSYYLDDPASRAASHARLAGLFRRDAGGDGSPPRWRADRPRGLGELPYHLAGAGDRDGADGVLTDLSFAEAKCATGRPWDLLDDYARALAGGAGPAVRAVRTALTAAFPAVLARPGLTAQSLFNRLAWAGPVPGLGSHLEAAQNYFDGKGPWLRAAGPLPDRAAGDGPVITFSYESVRQAVSPGGTLLAAAAADGQVEVRDLSDGRLVSRFRLPVEHLRPVAVADDGSLAYVDGENRVRATAGSAVLAGRPGETRLGWHPAAGVIAVRDDDALVAWDPVTGRADVLAAALPKPLRVVRVSPDGRTVLYVAGHSRQVIGRAIRVGAGWVARPVPYAGPPVADARLTPAGDVLVAGRDRYLRLLDPEAGTIRGQAAYEADPGVMVRGAPELCAAGAGLTAGWAYLATRDGHVARWNWDTGALERLEDARGLTEGGLPVLLEVIGGGAHVLLTHLRGGRSLDWAGGGGPGRFHHAAVGTCLFVGPGLVASASPQEQTVRWFAADGLDPAGVVALPRQEPIALAPDGPSRAVLVGTRQGLVFRCDPGGRAEHLGTLLEPVAAVARLPTGDVLVAGRAGALVRLAPDGSTSDVRINNNPVVRHRLFPAGRHGLYWTVHTPHGGDYRTVVALGDARGRELIVYEARDEVTGADFHPDGGLVVLAGTAGPDVKVISGAGGRWQVTHVRDAAVRHVAVLADGALLAVARADADWVEVWRVAPDLPTVAAVNLPAEASCVAAAGDRIAVGLRSGAVVSLQFRGEGGGR